MSKTLNEKLAAAVALVAKYQAAINAEAILNNIELQDRVTIKFGRAEKVRNIEGTVVGLNNTDNGLVVAVLSDDFTPYKVNARDIVANASAAGRDAGSAEVDALDFVADVDPLANAEPEVVVLNIEDPLANV